MKAPARRTKTTAISARGLLAALALCACAQPPASQAQTQAPEGSLFAPAPAQQWRLPDALREISGLAASADGRVFAHDDERAIITEIDVRDGRLVKNFALGDPIETGDFEGIAITPTGDFHLITSAGRLYSFREGADGAQIPFTTADTGLGPVCEIEGLAYFAAENSLIIACKRNQARPMRETVSLYAWPLGAEAPAAAPWLSLPEAALTRAAGVRRFRPSSVEIDPVSGRVLLLSASNGALAELSRDGAILAARALGPGHPQAEGVTIAPDGALIIADEAGRSGQALLSVYARIP